MAARRREEPPGAGLEAFKANVRYGPMFGCIVCMRACFLTDVEEVEQVEVLASPQAKQRFLDIDFLLAHKPLFKQFGIAWICKVCKASVNAGKMPKLASMNGLLPTWAFLPSDLQSLTPLEKETLALKQIFCQVEGLRDGVFGVGGPDKRFFLLLGNRERDFHLRDIVGLHLRPPHYQLQLRTEVTLYGHHFLLGSHHLYETNNKEESKEHMRNQLNQSVGVLPGVVEELVVGQQGGQQQELDWFSARGPRLDKLNCCVLPWKKPTLPLAASTLEKMMPNLVGQLAGLLDMRDEAGPEQPREVEITLAEWLLQRINHIHRRGLANDPLLLFALLHVIQTRRMKPMIDRWLRCFHSRHTFPFFGQLP